MKNSDYNKKMAELERQRKFDVDVNYGEYIGVKEQASNHRYIYNRFFDKVYYGFLRIIIFIFAPIILFFTYRLKIKGRKNLKKKGKSGAVIICNHVALLDSLIIKQAVQSHIYYVAADHNNKKGFGGYTLKILGLMPLSNLYSNQKNLNSAIETHLKNHKYVYVSPEQAMWRGYKKLRPFKNGAFYYATKNNVPVIPTVALLRDANAWDKFWGRKFKVTLQILPPIFPNANLAQKEAIEDLKLKSRQAMLEKMNEFYGTECDVEKCVFDNNQSL
ncbi:MAG: lysophospholipid acyltransferase family protein [Christensenellales bacterium]